MDFTLRSPIVWFLMLFLNLLICCINYLLENFITSLIIKQLLKYNYYTCLFI